MAVTYPAWLSAYRERVVTVVPPEPTFRLIARRKMGTLARFVGWLVSLLNRRPHPTTQQAYWPWISRHARRHPRSIGNHPEYVPEADE
jgi:hypothetical protein